MYIGDRIEPDDKAGSGNLARYIIRACFSQERMVYVPAKKIYEVDPPVCPKCQGQMKIISIIDDFELINTILGVTFRLKHLDLWDIRNHDLPEIEPVHNPELIYVEDYNNSGSQISVFDTLPQS